MQIFLSKNGQNDGPFTLDQIRDQVRANLLLMSNPAWIESWEDWKTVADLPGLLDVANTTSVPPTQISTPTINPNEVIWSGRPAWRCYAIWLTIGVLTTPLIIGLIILLWVFLERRQRHYTITRRSVILSCGLIFKSTDEIMLRDIRAVTIERKGIGAIFGLASMEFSSAARDGADVVFIGLTDAEKVRNLVNDLRS